MERVHEMTAAEALESLLRSYIQYYDVIREDVEPPFTAEARFHTHDEQYVFVKSARISEAESSEYVFFATAETLGANEVAALEDTAWERGLALVTPHDHHRNSDITLIILAEHIAPEAMAAVKKSRRYKSYRFTLQGWSSYRVIALELSSGTLACNRLGRDQKKLFRNIINQVGESLS